jgi:hypothetical protein
MNVATPQHPPLGLCRSCAYARTVASGKILGFSTVYVPRAIGGMHNTLGCRCPTALGTNYSSAVRSRNES